MTHGFEIVLLALTVWGEARSESYQGKLAVAYVICNRMKHRRVRVSSVVLKAWQFSFYNTADPSRDDISDIDPLSPVWTECFKAAAAAYFELQPDPTKGAEYYMNVEVVKRQNNGRLPKWWSVDGDEATEIKIDRHTFRRRR